MDDLYGFLKKETSYFDRENYQTQQAYNNALKVSKTVYVGNLSYATTQDSLLELFSKAGEIDRIILGLNQEGTPCGFCFVIYTTHESAERAVEYVNKSKINDRIIRVDWDAGYKEGREKGRGTKGHQKRDDFRTYEDSERPTNYRRKKFEKKQQRGFYQKERYQRDRNDYRGREGDEYGRHSRPYKRKEVEKNSDDDY